MSIQEISLKHSEPFPQLFPKVGNFSLMLGDPKVQEEFARVVCKAHSSIDVKIDPLTKRNLRELNAELVFGRDFRVVGPNGIHFLPFPLHTDKKEAHLLTHIFKSRLPRSADYFIEHPTQCGFGQGLKRGNVEDALDYARKNDLPRLETRSCIEGGNCFVFFDKEGELKAIVGIHSLVLTVIGLEMQGYFTDKKNTEALRAILATIDSPSDDALRTARNISLYNSSWRNFHKRLEEYKEQMSVMDPQEKEQQKDDLRKELKALGGEKELIKSLVAPLTDLERILYRNQALFYEAKERLARQVIADDLNVSLDKIAFVPQGEDFHIDMTMFVDPDGLTVYVDEAADQPPLIQALNPIGCRVIPLSGVGKTGGGHNFMNGVFISTPSKPLFITNGAQRSEAKDKFIEGLKGSKAQFDVAFLSAYMQRMVTLNGGGIHCLTWEKPDYTTPLEIIIFGYLADGRIPAQSIRNLIRGILPSLDKPANIYEVNDDE